MPQDKTPVGDGMTHRFPEQKIPQGKPAGNEPRRGGHRIAQDAPQPDQDNDAQLPDKQPPSHQRG